LISMNVNSRILRIFSKYDKYNERPIYVCRQEIDKGKNKTCFQYTLQLR
jgi:hypothetical protein